MEKKKTRMRYPAQAATETARQRRNRLALQRSVTREVEHAEKFGARPAPEALAPLAILKPSGELVMSFDAFQGGDYGQLCQMLGLRPSMPKANARRAARAAA